MYGGEEMARRRSIKVDTNDSKRGGKKINQKPYERWSLHKGGREEKEKIETDRPVLIRIQDVLIRTPDPP
jgi:hypothetical protein